MISSERDGATTHWFDVNFKGVDGLNKTTTMQVSFYPVLAERNRPAYFWELRRFVEELGYKNKQGLYKIVEYHTPSWKQEAATLGLDMTTDFRPSYTAGKAKSKRPMVECSPEFECSTQFMLGIIVRALTFNSSAARNKAAISFLNALFRRVLTDATAIRQLGFVDGDPTEVLTLCTAAPVVDGSCCHVQAAELKIHNGINDGDDIRNFIHIMATLRELATECPNSRSVVPESCWTSSEKLGE